MHELKGNKRKAAVVKVVAKDKYVKQLKRKQN